MGTETLYPEQSANLHRADEKSCVQGWHVDVLEKCAGAAPTVSLDYPTWDLDTIAFSGREFLKVPVGVVH